MCRHAQELMEPVALSRVFQQLPCSIDIVSVIKLILFSAQQVHRVRDAK